MEILFWLALICAGYSYFIYPLILLVWPKREPSPSPAAADASPAMSLIITVRNESGRIEEKLRNSLQIDYPAEKLEIIVASDASDDGTDDIVRRFGSQGVRLVRSEPRAGKETAQRAAIEVAHGEVLVFSDVATRIPGAALRRMAEAFTDTAVGAVSSEDHFVTPDGAVIGEGLYVRYEMWLRRLESAVGGVVGLSGSFFAARASVCTHWDVLVPSDFNTALNCARNGLVAVSDPNVRGQYAAIQDEAREYQRKLRTVLRGITGLLRAPGVLNPFRYGFFAFQVWSHKVMRWLVPWFLLVVLGTSVLLAGRSPLYALLLALELFFYGLVLAGAASPTLRGRSFVKVPYFFIQVNVAIAHATLAYLGGRRMTVWQPSKR